MCTTPTPRCAASSPTGWARASAGDDPDLAQTRTELAHALLAADRAHNTATARDLLAQALAAFTALGPAYAPEAEAAHP